MIAWDLVGLGVAGGAIAELAKWYKIRSDLHKGLPSWSKSPFYWIVTVLMALTGGLLVWLYMDADLTLNGFLAFNIGASAPLIIERLVQQTPSLDLGEPE